MVLIEKSLLIRGLARFKPVLFESQLCLVKECTGNWGEDVAWHPGRTSPLVIFPSLTEGAWMARAVQMWSELLGFRLGH